MLLEIKSGGRSGYAPGHYYRFGNETHEIFSCHCMVWRSGNETHEIFSCHCMVWRSGNETHEIFSCHCMVWRSGNETHEIFSCHCCMHSSAFYERIGQKPPSEEQLLDTLRKAVANSREKRYHGDKGIEVLSPEGVCVCVCVCECV